MIFHKELCLTLTETPPGIDCQLWSKVYHVSFISSPVSIIRFAGDEAVNLSEHVYTSNGHVPRTAAASMVSYFRFWLK